MSHVDFSRGTRREGRGGEGPISTGICCSSRFKSQRGRNRRKSTILTHTSEEKATGKEN
jgi:hypothetical protein